LEDLSFENKVVKIIVECIVNHFRPEEGEDKFLRNVGNSVHGGITLKSTVQMFTPVET
jgi:hypothetical protein